MIRCLAILVVCLSVTGMLSGTVLRAGEPSLHERIDGLIEAAADGPPTRTAPFYRTPVNPINN